MASVKLFSLAVRTLAKPIANTIKSQAAEHETFRNICIAVAQRTHRLEARMRMGLLNEEAKNIKPLNDTRAVQNGATTLAETFLFLVAAGLVLGETYRSNRKDKNRRDDVRERLESLEDDIKSIKGLLETGAWKEELESVRERNENFERILTTVVNNGLRAGWLSLGHNDGMDNALTLLNHPSQPSFEQTSFTGDENNSSTIPRHFPKRDITEDRPSLGVMPVLPETHVVQNLDK